MALPTQAQMNALKSFTDEDSEAAVWHAASLDACVRHNWLTKFDDGSYGITELGAKAVDRGRVSAASDKHNMRFPNQLWADAEEKAQRIGISMTAVANAAYVDFLAENDEDSAIRLGARLARGL